MGQRQREVCDHMATGRESAAVVAEEVVLDGDYFHLGRLGTVEELFHL